MKKIITAFLLGFVPVLALASGGGVKLDKADIDLHDQDSLRRGAKLFVNYCLSCHSAAYMRYNRMGQDLGLTDAQVKENLMFAAEKVGETMTIAMPADDAKRWFGTKVPDLSVVARARGADWLYSYLRGFHLDSSRPWGVNNTVFKDVGMPHVLWELEGLKKPVYEVRKNHEGEEEKHIVGFETVQPGKLSSAEYDLAVRDLVNFMVYMGEPAKLVRYKIGVWVLLYLVILFVVAYALKKEYWKDVH
ncbi:MAG TPA: cytochrome c1 [Gammaproteobacteria bacterium]|nr:cytochrome c1 [Gammaproteobacteria bacterium]